MAPVMVLMVNVAGSALYVPPVNKPVPVKVIILGTASEVQNGVP